MYWFRILPLAQVLLLPALLLIQATALAAGEQGPDLPPDEAAQTSAQAVAPLPGYPLTLTDSLGRTVRFEAPPRRIVSLTPSNTECVFALGAGSRVFGVTSFCDHPAEARAITKIGGFAVRTINVEAIVALRPDLVLTGDEGHRPLVETLEQLGIRCFAVKVRGFDELFAHLEVLGSILGNPEQGRARAATLRAKVAHITRLTAALPREKRVRVYWEVFDEPLMSCGPRSIIGQLIELAGGDNIFADLGEEFPQVSAEAVILRDPQVILGPVMMRARSLTLERLRGRPGWERITALREGRLQVFPDDCVARPTPRLVDGLELIATALHPELFSTSAP